MLVVAATSWMARPVVRRLVNLGKWVRAASKSGTGPIGASGCAVDMLDEQVSRVLLERVAPGMLMQTAWGTTHDASGPVPRNARGRHLPISMCRRFLARGSRKFVELRTCAACLP